MTSDGPRVLEFNCRFGDPETQALLPRMKSDLLPLLEATIDGNIATFKPEDTETCEITLVFLPGKLRVEQSGSDADCGFGHNVYSTGVYKKVRSGKPKFENPFK